VKITYITSRDTTQRAKLEYALALREPATNDAEIAAGERGYSDGAHGKSGYDPPLGRSVPAIGVEPEQALDPLRPDGRQDRHHPEKGRENNLGPSSEHDRYLFLATR